MNSFTTVVDSYTALQLACSQGFNTAVFAVPGWSATESLKIFNATIYFSVERMCYAVTEPSGGILKCAPMNTPHMLLWVDGRRFYLPVILLQKQAACPVFTSFVDLRKQIQLLHMAQHLGIVALREPWIRNAINETQNAISDSEEMARLKHNLSIARLAILTHTKRVCCICGSNTSRVTTFRCNHKCVCVRCSVDPHYVCIVCNK